MLLYIEKQEISTTPFTIISQSNFTDKNNQITFGILAESHFFTIQTSDSWFNEICACTTFDSLSTIPYKIYEIQDQLITTEHQHYSYQFIGRILKEAEAEEELKTLRKKKNTSNTHYLEHTFPKESADSDSACTEVYVTIGEVITIESVHTYPNEGLAVFTKSSYILK